jgi:cytochrome c biogenesis protein CcmG/thiol:disulfide interchange protein DsbE
VTRLISVLLAIALLAGCTERERVAEPPSPAPAPARLADASPELRRLAAQANELLPGGPAAFERRLRELRGHPVVVNKWASWCDPCRAEFPVFGAVATELGAEVAFLGVNAEDSAGAARRFLAKHPVPYPHYSDPDQEVAKVFRGNAFFPTTAFYDERGRFRIALQKPYRTAAELRRDIDRYARG